MLVRSWEVSALSVPLLEPFVIASGVVTTTRNALVRVTLEDASGQIAVGLGEAATLVPVTREDQPDVIATLTRIGDALRGTGAGGGALRGDGTLEIAPGFEALTAALDEVAAEAPVARAGAETALLDAIARLAGMPLRVLLGGAIGARTTRMTTDITIPIRDVERMAWLAREHRRRGFTCFKVKVGRDVAHDLAAIAAIAAAVPDARFRLDANAGFSAEQARALMDALALRRVAVECFEQPCQTDDLGGMAEVTAAIEPPVIADESVKDLADLERVTEAQAADGVNLKLAKSGGILAALAVGRAAQARGLRVMCGGMVETRVGMTAAAHVVAALGGVDFVDLDTAWLLADDPFTGGYAATGPDYTLSTEAGLGVSPR